MDYSDRFDEFFMYHSGMDGENISVSDCDEKYFLKISPLALNGRSIILGTSSSTEISIWKRRFPKWMAGAWSKGDWNELPSQIHRKHLFMCTGLEKRWFNKFISVGFNASPTQSAAPFTCLWNNKISFSISASLGPISRLPFFCALESLASSPQNSIDFSTQLNLLNADTID